VRINEEEKFDCDVGKGGNEGLSRGERNPKGKREGYLTKKTGREKFNLEEKVPGKHFTELNQKGKFPAIKRGFIHIIYIERRSYGKKSGVTR